METEDDADDFSQIFQKRFNHHDDIMHDIFVNLLDFPVQKRQINQRSVLL